jgi:hypothetical protein
MHAIPEPIPNHRPAATRGRRIFARIIARVFDRGIAGIGRCIALLLLAALGAAGPALANPPDANNQPALAARYLLLKDHLDHTQFQRPLYMESRESNDSVSGEVYALISFPFASVGAALSQPGQWCEIMILHLNTKYCHMSAQGTVLDVAIGKKFDQPLDAAYRVNFVFRANANGRDYLQLQLTAESGPISTKNYRIIYEAMPAEGGKTFMRLSYAYDFGFTGRVAMGAYLATTGSSKVGFTIDGKKADGSPNYIGGMRGLVERNTMRYYLAVDAYMGALATAPPARIEKSFRDWYAGSERYPRQLHEMEQTDYLAMKRKEYLRQQTALVAAAATVQ